MNIRMFALVGLMMSLLDSSAAERFLTPPGNAGRSVTIAKNGMVATSHPLAAQIGLDILKQGGNATDAAVAASAAMGLMEPMSCGIGGDLFAIVWDAKTKTLHGLHANGGMPMLATREFFKQKNLKEIPETGPYSWSVPGCVDGWDQLLSKFGSKSFAELLGPSIEYADDGFPVPEVIAGYWKSGMQKLLKDPGSSATYLIGGKVPKTGDIFKNPVLAATYRAIAKNGGKAFYTGTIAKELDQFAKSQGALLRLEDLQQHKSMWMKPLHVNYRGYDVYELTPPGQGIAVLQMLNMLKHEDLAKIGPNSADYWQLLVETKKLVFEDRAKFYADPGFAKLPIDELLSDAYAMKRRKLIDLKRAATAIPPGDPKLGMADTIYLCTADRWGNCVSLIQSNYFGFGSGLTDPQLGFAMQNRGTLLSLDENHLNRLEPKKKPFHTIIPAMVMKDGKPIFVFGVMGGDMQPQGHVQILINILDFGMNIQVAGEAPRMEHIGSSKPNGSKQDQKGGTLLIERGMPLHIIEDLKKRGHQIRIVDRNGGGYQGIWIDPKTGIYHGASEARKDGMAVGY
ncbi:MAG: gamma-glutamyltransferase [Zavarzinella sp.]